LADRQSVIAGLVACGVYRSQFETSISNGGLTAFAGGDRDRWEERLFGGAYHRPAVPPRERPKYGGLNLMGYADGACPRFGSCHLRLRARVLSRCTFCLGDSHTGPAVVGTIDVLEPILAASAECIPPPQGELGRALDDYVEAQIHGDIRLADDVEAVVCDPSFGGSGVETGVRQLQDRFGIAVEWHAGFALPAHEVPPHFRGPAVATLAGLVKERFGDPIDAARIGAAAASVVQDPGDWRSWAEPEVCLQQLKQLWHVLVRYGRTSAA
jgi:hypothetical protein